MRHFILTLILAGHLMAVAAMAESAVDDGWVHSSEAGISLSGGNTDSQSFNLKQETNYSWKPNTIKTNGHFLLNRTDGSDAAKNWDIWLEYERSLGDTFGAFVRHGWEGDTFSGFEYRANLGAGASMNLLKGKDKADYLLTQLGYQFANEQRVASVAPRSINSHYARLYFEGGKRVSEHVTFKTWLELLPDLSDSDNLLITFEPSMNVVLSSYFSLKLAFKGTFDNEPAITGNERFDYLYTTSLVATY